MLPNKTTTDNDSNAGAGVSNSDNCSLAEIAVSTKRPFNTVQRWLRKGWLQRSGPSQGFTERICVTRASLDALLESGKLRTSRKQQPPSFPTPATIISSPRADGTISKSVEAPTKTAVPEKRKNQKSGYKNAKRILRRLPMPILTKLEKWIQVRTANSRAHIVEAGSAQLGAIAPVATSPLVAPPLQQEAASTRSTAQ